MTKIGIRVALSATSLCCFLFTGQVAQAAPKTSVAVAPVEWSSAPSDAPSSAAAIHKELVAALKKSGRYRVVDEPTDKQSALERAQMGVQCVVTDAAQQTSEGKRFSLGRSDQQLMRNKQASTFRITMDVQIYDAQTDDILDTAEVRAEGKTTSTGVDVITQEGQLNRSAGAAQGQITKDLVAQAVKAIDLGVSELPWTSEVRAVSGGKAVIVGGTRDGVEKGMEFELYELGKPVIDEETGEVLDRGEETKVGKLRVTQAKEKVSYLAKVSGKSPRKGNIIKFVETIAEK